MTSAAPGWSDPGPFRWQRSYQNSTDDLHRLIIAAGDDVPALVAARFDDSEPTP